MNSKLLFLLICVFQFTGYAQRKPLDGRVYSGNIGIKDVLVVNFSGQTDTRTDSLGNFELAMQIGDLLIVSDRKIVTKKIRYTPDLVKNNVVMLEVTPEVIEIEEVIITRSAVTSASLGIPMGKKYTPAERRLRTASGLDPTIMVGTMPGVSISFDAILNALNGRTKRLKKELEIERKELALQKLDDLFTADYYTNRLAVPSEKVPAFKYFAVEDEEFMSVLSEGRTDRIELSLTALAEKYINLNNDGK